MASGCVSGVRAVSAWPAHTPRIQQGRTRGRARGGSQIAQENRVDKALDAVMALAGAVTAMAAPRPAQ